MSPYSGDAGRVAVYEKGILIGFEYTQHVQGIVESDAVNAARDRHAQLSLGYDTGWISQVRSKAFATCRHLGERLAVQQIFLSLQDADANQPLFLKNRRILTPSELMRQIIDENLLLIRLIEDSDDLFVWKAASNLSALIGLEVDERRVYPLATFDGQVGPTTNISELLSKSDDALFRFLRDVRDSFGEGASVEYEHHERDGYHEDYIEIRIGR